VSTAAQMGAPATGLVPRDLILQGNAFSCSGVFVRRDVALSHPFDEERALAGTEDWVLWLRLMARFPMFESPVLTWSLIQHDTRSVSLASLQHLQKRISLVGQVLEKDPAFMRTFGDKALDRVLAEMHSYAALHAALGTSDLRTVMAHLARSGRASPRGLLRRRTLATFKHLALNTMSRSFSGQASHG
jgi:hypothetical protein